ncbi:MAG: OmpA family protein [Pseudomonadota bacterium]
MRTILGVAVLCAGLGGLGWWASTIAAPAIEAQVRAEAEAALGFSIHGAAVSVTGRDITLSGLVDSEEERTALIAALEQIGSRRVVQDATSLLPAAVPFELTVMQDGNRLGISGAIPSETARRTLASGGLGAAVGRLELASGAPPNWVEAVQATLAAGRALKRSEFRLSDQTLSLVGLAADPTALERAQSALAAVPGNFSQNIDIDLEDDGRPFRLEVSYARGGPVTAEGKLPNVMTAESLAVLEGALDASGLRIARIDSPDGLWDETASAALSALSQLDVGRLELTSRNGSLVGEGTRAGRAAAEEALSALPSGYQITSELALVDDGAPIVLKAEKAMEAAPVLAGKLPFGAAPEEFGVPAFPDEVAVAEIDARSPQFLELAAGGVALLERMMSGTLDVTDAETPRLTLVGLARNPAAIAAIEAASADLPGQVSLDLVAADDGAPLSLVAEKTPEETTATGKLPMGSALDLGPGVARAGVTMGPDGFEAAATAAIAALQALTTGMLDVSGTTIQLAGSGTRTQIALALDALDLAPAGFAVDTDLAPLDDGLPLGLTGSKDGDVITLVGKMPFGTEPAALGLATFEEAVIVSEIDANAPAFLEVAQSGLIALSAMEMGQLVILDGEEPGDPAQMRLEGDVTRAGLVTVNAALEGLPEGVTPAINVVFADDGAPIALFARDDGDGLVLAGKLPFDAEPGDLGVEAFSDEVVIAEIDALDRSFLRLAARGLRALAALESGAFEIIDADAPDGEATLGLSGIALSPAERGEALAALAGAEASVDITLLDDGTPITFTLSYTSSEGAALSGKLPAGLAPQRIASDLGLPAIESTATRGFIGSPELYDASALALWLPEMQALQATFGPDGLSALNVTPAPGVDGELLADSLSRDAGVPVTVTSPTLPARGETRDNLVSGLAERFSGAAWLPIFGFEPDLARCDAEARAVLDGERIDFVEGEARLDARAMRAVNKLAGVISHCRAAVPGLTVEIGGHTDAVGTAEDNAALSEARARAVRDALVARGVNAAALEAVGYGETQPIADNATEEGRALNRRTELSWFEP